MGDLPAYASLAGTSPASLYGALAQRAEPALAASYEFGWQRESALLLVIDEALGAAAAGAQAPDAAKPRWLDGLVARELRALSTTHWSRDRFLRVRLLERLGLVSLEADDTYVLAMVSGLGPDRAAQLRADPDLVDRALWRVFEVEGGGEISLTNVDRYGGGGWRTAFLELSADGTIDRARVLEGCLGALNRDFAAYRAGWYAGTYLAFEPTLDELAGAQPDLRRLLGAAVPATVAFALKQLLLVHKAGRLDVGETLDALPPATLVKAKATALEAVRLARTLQSEHPQAAAKVGQTALGHSHGDVQRAAASLLADCGDPDAVAAAADDLTPSVRQDLGLGAAVAAPTGVQPVQRLAAPAPPVATAEVAERTAALLEDASDVSELEAVLASLVAPGVDQVLASLRKRAKAVVARGPNTDLGDAWLPGQLARLVLSVLGETSAPAEPDLPAQRFVARRLAELRQTEAPLLATPDLPGGFVSPRALVERLALHPVPRHHDMVAALLRLHPDGRDEIAADRAEVPAAVRFALDGVAPPRRDGPASWWIAAERSRAPYAASELPVLSGEIRTHTWIDNGRERRSQHARFTVTTGIAQRPCDDQPTELHAQTTDRWANVGASRFLADWIPTLAAIWPHDAEHFLALTCLPVLESTGWAEAAHDVPRTLDAVARHPGRMGALTAGTLAAGISATQRDHRLHAIDAFVDLALSGRIPLADLAVTMARYAQAWPANRWAESLASVSQAPGGAEAAVELLTLLLPQLPADHRGLNKLLELLRDQSIHLGLRPTDPALVGWLDRFTGSSAAARSARLLLG